MTQPSHQGTCYINWHRWCTATKQGLENWFEKPRVFQPKIKLIENYMLQLPKSPNTSHLISSTQKASGANTETQPLSRVQQNRWLRVEFVQPAWESWYSPQPRLELPYPERGRSGNSTNKHNTSNNHQPRRYTTLWNTIVKNSAWTV